MNRMSKHRGPSSSLGTLSNSGWNTKRLGELAELDGRIGWRGLTAQEYTKSGPLFLSVHSLNYGDVVDFRDAFHITQARYDESPEIMLRLGDILICKDGAGIGKVGIVAELPSQATINSSLLLIRPANSILPKYLYYCLSSPYFQQIVLSRLNGATTPHLYQRDITDFPVHFPCFTEQERIVAILDKAFGGIERASIKCGMALENTRDAFESYRDLLFADSAGGVGNRLDELVSFRNGVNFTKSSRGKTVAIVGVKDFQNRFSTPTEDLAYVTIDGDVTADNRPGIQDALSRPLPDDPKKFDEMWGQFTPEEKGLALPPRSHHRQPCRYAVGPSGPLGQGPLQPVAPDRTRAASAGGRRPDTAQPR